MNKPVLNLLGLAERARKLTSGEGMVMDAIRHHKAKLVIVATDASQNTKEKALNKGEYYQVPVIIALESASLSQSIGKQRKIIAITDEGFANKIQSLLH